MRAVVTGAAGFIGSTLVDRLLGLGHQVVGIDSFTDYYEPSQKRANLRDALQHPSFHLVEDDLATGDLDLLVEGADIVYHQAAQPGVRLSWAAFPRYERDNVLATQRLLEALRTRPQVRLVYASSSSVYGRAERFPTTEHDLPAPHSPYGVTKLAGEHLCAVYARNWGVPAVALRYFTVYGPRQRPDMALYRLVDAACSGQPFPLFGDGQQIRDFTYVSDIVDANLAAGAADLAAGTVLNVAGTESSSLNELVALVERVTGREVRLDRRPPAQGDVPRTGGDASAAATLLGWSAATSLEEGVRRQVAWQAGLVS